MLNSRFMEMDDTEQEAIASELFEALDTAIQYVELMDSENCDLPKPRPSEIDAVLIGLRAALKKARGEE